MLTCPDHRAARYAVESALHLASRRPALNLADAYLSGLADGLALIAEGVSLRELWPLSLRTPERFGCGWRAEEWKRGVVQAYAEHTRPEEPHV